MTTTATTSLDLEAYRRRIGHTGDLAPDLSTLQALVAAHTRSIPFENFDPLMGRTPDLSLEGLQRKLVADGRGGWCFEHNLLLMQVLEAIGFSVTGLAARVLFNQPEDAITPRSHMLLKVDLPEGAHIVDVGFGGLTLTGVLRLETEDEQATPHGPFRLKRVGEERHMQAWVREAWSTLYRFDLSPQLPLDYGITNFYLANFPGSPFVQNLMAARPAEGVRYGFRNRQLSIHHQDGRREVRELTSLAELKEALATHLQVSVPESEALDTALSRLLK